MIMRSQLLHNDAIHNNDAISLKLVKISLLCDNFVFPLYLSFANNFANNNFKVTQNAVKT